LQAWLLATTAREVWSGAELHAGAATGRAIGIGLKVKMIRKAPSPMIQEPI
jgi:hypothetical protein